MKKNVGTADKLVRLTTAVVVFALIAADVLAGTWAWVLGGLAVVFVVTALINWCPIWASLGVNTAKKES